MSSLVELIFSAVGTEAAGSAIEGVSGKIADMTRELGRFATVGLTVESAFEGVKGALADGEMFTQLKARTGENIKDLVVMTQEFKNAGLGAEFIGTSANLLQRALGGVNEMGGRTETAFQRLGTSIAQLKPLTYAQQLQVLGEGFSKIQNQSERANIAMQIFGRGGGMMLQLLGDPKAMKEAAEQAGRYGDMMQQNAAHLKEVEEHLGVVNQRMKELYLTAAESLLPTMENIAGLFKELDLRPVGSFLGGSVPIVFASGMATMLVKTLDNSVLDWATRSGNPIGQAFAGQFVAPITGLLSRALPVALAAAIGFAIGKGIHDAIDEARANEINKLSAIEGDVGDTTTKDLHGLRDATNQGELDAAKNQIRADIKEAQFTIYELSRKKKLHDEGAAAGPWAGPKFNEEDQTRLDATKQQLETLQRTFDHPVNAQSIFAQNKLKEIRESLEPLVTDLSQLREQNDKLTMQDMDPAQKAKLLQSRRTDVESQLGQTMPAGLDKDSVEARRLSLENQLLEIKHQQAENNAKLTEQETKLTEEKKKQADAAERQQVYALETQIKVAEAAGNDQLAQKLKQELELKQAQYSMSGLDLDLAKQRLSAELQIFEAEQKQKGAKAEIEAEKSALEKQLSDIRENIASMQGDETHTQAEQWSTRKQAIEEEIATIKKTIDTENALAAAARGPGGAGEQVAVLHDNAATQASNQLAGAQHEKAGLGPNPDDVGEQLQVESQKVANSMGTVAEQIGRSWGSAAESMRSSMANSLYDMLEHTRNFKQAAGALYISLVQDLARSGSQMASNWMMTHVVMDVARRGFHALGVGEQATATGTETTIHTGGEAAKTAATAGGAAARGGIRILETVFHGIQVGIRTTMHIAGEAMQTAVTMVQTGLRIAAAIAESIAKIISAAAGAMAAMASIPYVGPILAVAAMAAIVAAGIQGIAHEVSMSNIRKYA
ncbi:MAG TPA: hypothetical protein VNW30_10105 [Opitutaceae bacterium]|jgi:hypothetical protein|nr:hypothetical protein [Opitutaceae bacterium]